MPRIDVGTSIDDIKDEGVSPVDAGVYEVKVEVAELRDNKAGDAKLVYLEYSIVEPDEAAGRKLFDRVSLKPAALWKLKRFLTAADVPFEGASFDTEDILGQTLSVQVSVGEWNGKPKNDVDDYVVSE